MEQSTAANSIPTGTGATAIKDRPAVDRLREKSAILKGPRGQYRCRKCKSLPCVCPDPKKGSAAPVTPAPVPHQELFTEASSKRLLESAFGIPVVLTRCRLWALTDEEALELAKPTAVVLNEFVTVEPKWVALALLSVSLGSIVSRKAVMFAAWRQAMILQAQTLKSAGSEKPAEGSGTTEATEPVKYSETDRKPGPSASDALGLKQ